MKRGILLNSGITGTIAEMGHTDGLTICDAGLPINNSTKRIDLAVKAGIPSFADVLGTVLDELCVERVVLAEEIKSINPEGFRAISAMIKKYEEETGYSVQMDFISHEEFKIQTGSTKAVIRTGEVKPYANIILYSGVVF